MKALVGVMALGAVMAAGPVLAMEGDLCPDPKEVQGFKTCADVAKAQAEGEVVVYATNPEAAELQVLAGPARAGRSQPGLRERPATAHCPKGHCQLNLG